KGNLYIGTTGEGIYVMDDNIPKKMAVANTMNKIVGFAKLNNGVLISDNQNGLTYLFNKQIKKYYSSPNPIYNHHYFVEVYNNKVYTSGIFGLLAYENGGITPHPFKFSVTSFHFINNDTVILNSFDAA